MLKQLLSIATICLMLGTPALAQGPRRVAMGDWPEARGANRDGTSAETGLPTTWDMKGSNLLWRAPFGGRSAPIVMGNHVYVQNPSGRGTALQERVMALDADSGKVLWEGIVGGPVVTSTITYAVKGKQYVMIFTGEGQSVTAGPMQLTMKTMPKPVRGHNSIVVFALP